MAEDKGLRILILEDVPADSELVERELSRGGIVFSSRRVDTREGFLSALEEFRPDIILSDFSLPAFDGLSALAIVKERRPEVPFVFVTGAMGEEWAIETIRRGATDYVLKDKLSKLAPAVQRALLEAEERRRRILAEEELRRKTHEIAESEARLRLIIEKSPDAMIVISEKNRVLFANPSSERLFGRPAAELTGADFGFPVAGKETTEIEVLSGDGMLKTAELHLVDIEWEGQKAFLLTLRDISERKAAEDAFKERLAELERFRDATIKREFRIRELKDRVLELEAEMNRLKVSPQAGGGL